MQKILKENRNGKIIGYVIKIGYKNKTLDEKEINNDVFSTEITNLKPFR